MRKRTTELRTGDIVRAQRPWDSQEHVWIIFETSISADKECVRAFNLTGSPAPEGEKMIEIAKKDIPDNFFPIKKPRTFARINDGDCLLLEDVTEHLGVAKTVCPGILDEVCQQTYSCDVSSELHKLCDCEYGIIERKVELNQIVPPPCDCDRAVYFYQ